MKRKFISTICATSVCMSLAFPSLTNAQDIKIYLDGQPLVSDQPAITQNGRVLVPLRLIFDRLGAKAEWDAKTKTVIASKDQWELHMKIGSKRALTKGNAVVELDVPPIAIDGRTLVPARFVTENLGGDIKWDKDTRTVHIISKK